MRMIMVCHNYIRSRFIHRSDMAFKATITVESDIKTAANAGWRSMPLNAKTPAASGMAIILYSVAQNKFWISPESAYLPHRILSAQLHVWINDFPKLNLQYLTRPFLQPLIAEDTGFFMEAYKGFPGTNPKWVVERIGLEGILKLASGKSRKGCFQTVICFIESPESYRFFEGKMHGKLSKKIINPNADTMPYNKIFTPDGDKRVLAEMSEKEKLSFLQRTIATRKLGKWLKEKSH